jgi:serine/threonine protein kinase
MTESNQFGNFGKAASGSDPVQNDRQFASGQVLIGKYEVMSLIGVGGMGKVYKVRQVFLNKALALKVLDLHQAMSELQMRRFQLEAKAAFSLSHPNLVKVFDFGLLETEDPYLVMDFVDGITLHDHLKKEGPLTPEQCVKVFIQAASGLAYAHQRSVVHRDIKPSNIMLDAGSKIGANNSIKIVDFGIAKLSESGEIQGLTRTGEIFGSPLYMSPEQCSGENVDHRSDIYSLGCTLFEALTGTPPHVGNSALRTMMLHQTSPAPLLREASLGVTYPENLEQIVHRMLEKSPADRYQSLDDVVEDLNKALGQAAIVIRPSISLSPGVSDDAKMISMKPVNFGLLLVSVMALTAAASVGTDRFLQARLWGHKAVAANSVLPHVRAEEILAERSRVGDVGEVDKSLKMETDIASRAFEKAALIKPTFRKIQGVDGEEITFPEISIGRITNCSFARKLPPDMVPFDLVAKNSVRFPPSNLLQLQLGGNELQLGGDKYSQGLKNPSILKKVDPALFQELEIEASPVDIFLGGSFDIFKQSEQVVKVLNIAANWSSLDGFSLSELNVTKDTIKALSNLKKLQYLKLWHCGVNMPALIKEPLLQRLKYLSLCRIPCEEIIDSICHSAQIESISLSECTVSAYSLDQLRLCPRLIFLDLRVEKLGERELVALTKLKKLEILSIRDSDLSPDQLKFLLLKCPSLKKLQLNGVAAGHVKARLVEDPRITILN